MVATAMAVAVAVAPFVAVGPLRYGHAPPEGVRPGAPGAAALCCPIVARLLHGTPTTTHPGPNMPGLCPFAGAQSGKVRCVCVCGGGATTRILPRWPAVVVLASLCAVPGGR